MLITGDSDGDRDSDSCPVLFDTFVDYRSKASYVGSKNGAIGDFSDVVLLQGPIPECTCLRDNTARP